MNVGVNRNQHHSPTCNIIKCCYKQIIKHDRKIKKLYSLINCCAALIQLWEIRPDEQWKELRINHIAADQIKCIVMIISHNAPHSRRPSGGSVPTVKMKLNVAWSCVCAVSVWVIALSGLINKPECNKGSGFTLMCAAHQDHWSLYEVPLLVNVHGHCVAHEKVPLAVC